MEISRRIESKTYLILAHANFLNGVVQEPSFSIVHMIKARSVVCSIDVVGGLMDLDGGPRLFLVEVGHGGGGS